MITVNEIAFSKERYDNDRDKMMIAVAKQLDVLLKNNYVCKVREDDFEVIVIEFEHDNRVFDYGTPNLYWLTNDEMWYVEERRNDGERDDE